MECNNDDDNPGKYYGVDDTKDAGGDPGSDGRTRVPEGDPLDPGGIEAHGFWTAAADVKPRLFVLASYAAGEEPAEVARRYMQSKEFADDTRDFDVSSIVGVESTNLMPSPGSPLT